MSRIFFVKYNNIKFAPYLYSNPIEAESELEAKVNALFSLVFGPNAELVEDLPTLQTIIDDE